MSFGSNTWYLDDDDLRKTEFCARNGIQDCEECEICINTTPEMCMKHAHKKAHEQAHIEASEKAEAMALEEAAEDYIDYYTFFYRREYKKLYKQYRGKYYSRYYDTVLHRPCDKICSYHNDLRKYDDDY